MSKRIHLQLLKNTEGYKILVHAKLADINNAIPFRSRLVVNLKIEIKMTLWLLGAWQHRASDTVWDFFTNFVFPTYFFCLDLKSTSRMPIDWIKWWCKSKIFVLKIFLNEFVTHRTSYVISLKIFAPSFFFVLL